MYENNMVKQLSLESDTFEEMKRNFNFVLQRLLGTMEERECNDGSITLKMEVSIASEFIPNFNKDKQGETREIKKPSFKHKVTSSVQIKDEKSGNLDSEMELVMDEDTGTYILRPVISTEQRSIFDPDFNENIHGGDGNVVYTDNSALTGRKVAEISGPVAGDDDTDETPEASNAEENTESGNLPTEEEKHEACGHNESTSGIDEGMDLSELPYTDSADEYHYDEPEDDEEGGEEY